MSTLYEKDFYAWANQSAALLRQHNFEALDIENIAEELEDMGISNQHALMSRLAVLLQHLLKWKFQPARRGKSWRLTIEEQRRAILRLLKANPSLKGKIDLEEAYKDGVLRAARETDFEKSDFPQEPCFTLEQCLDIDYLPN